MPDIYEFTVGVARHIRHRLARASARPRAGLRCSLGDCWHHYTNCRLSLLILHRKI